jgi:hypothetical protein
MATPQLSPGVLVREVDLTVGRVDNVIDNIGAIAGPFKLGPVDEPTTITTQSELLNVFGSPISTDRHYEYWMTASEFLQYGGILSVVRTDGTNLNQANAGVGIASTTSLKIKNYDDYQEEYSTANNFTYAGKYPGEWGNNLKVCSIDNAADQIIGVSTTSLAGIGATIGYGVTSTLSSAAIPGAGTTTTFNGMLKGIITGLSTDATNGNSTINVKIVSRVNTAGTEFPIDYQENNPAQSFEAADTLSFVNNSGTNESTASAVSVEDWYDNQKLQLDNSTIFWKTIAPKPVDGNYVSSRGGGGDSIHFAIVDDTGEVTGIQGNLLETWSFLSKALDAEAADDAPTKTYYKNYLALNSQWIYAGYNPSQKYDTFHGTLPVATGFSTDVTNTTTQTNNLLKYYAPLTSSSYCVFDSGYKYMYDRFNNDFVYVPLNGDIAGLMVRTSIESFPWFSPAGQQRGNINNGVKLAYNPTKAQRDVLYGARINSVINQNGQGIILFGDKTALSYASAFDRINVRRLFLTVEQALEEAANDQLFEINDEETRENFVNIVVPYLRDIQANRGIEDFTVICDETNNTPDVIDNNEFRADIFISPARSINYVTLTFVATRSGVSFDEVVGTV